MKITRVIRAARTLRKHGVSAHIRGNSYRLARECFRIGFPVSAACAVATLETNFQNEFGHDPAAPDMHGAPVTRASYRRMLALAGRGPRQGCGQFQLTSAGLQDRADQLGGCWRNSANVRVGVEFLAQLRQEFGEREGFRHFNGSGPAAEHYADEAMALEQRWHQLLVKG
ncbi:MAG TPA: hypothetical protein VF032_19525 [Thermoleophilaceae bacterium]